jgi:hypothetical protein
VSTLWGVRCPKTPKSAPGPVGQPPRTRAKTPARLLRQSPKSSRRTHRLHVAIPDTLHNPSYSPRIPVVCPWWSPGDPLTGNESSPEAQNPNAGINAKQQRTQRNAGTVQTGAQGRPRPAARQSRGLSTGPSSPSPAKHIGLVFTGHPFGPDEVEGATLPDYLCRGETGREQPADIEGGDRRPSRSGRHKRQEQHPTWTFSDAPPRVSECNWSAIVAFAGSRVSPTLYEPLSPIRHILLQAH